MKRKVVQQGPATLMVSLPSKWAKENNVIKGDEINITENEAELVIGMSKRENYQKTSITLISGNSWYIDQVIRNLYLAGCDEISVKFKDKSTIVKIQGIVNRLLGFEVIEQNDNSCIIKNLSSGIETELDNILRKIFLLNKSLIQVTIDQLQQKRYDLQRVKDIRDNIHRFCNFYRRTITKKKMHGLIQNRAIFIILVRIMMICNNILYAHKYICSKKNISNLKITIDYLKKVSNLYNVFYDTFYSKDFSKLSEMNHMRDELINKDLTKILETSKGENSVLCHYYAEVVRLIATNGGSIVEYHFGG